jgi:hypothetical protein
MLHNLETARGWKVGAMLCALAALAFFAQSTRAQDEISEVDTAIIVSVDVSSSVDQRRYLLQMEGIAAALQDPEVLNTVLSGPQGKILFSMVTWADKSRFIVPWTVISNKDEAISLADKVRNLPQDSGEFTCLARMLRYVADKVVARMPVKANKIVVDVSGDGPDNCNTGTLIDTAKSDLFASGATINGLPILEGADAATIEGWYRDNVIGGPGSFVMAAQGYDDVARAFRQKFVIEVSESFPVNSRLR